MQRRHFLAGAAIAGGTGWTLPGLVRAQAADYPSRPIRMLVGFAAGGTPDTIARTVAEAMSRALGQPITVDNRAGANGIIAAEALAKAAPDGYTVLVTTASLVVNPSVYRKLPYDLDRDLAPVTNIALGDGYLLICNPRLGVSSVRELVDYGKKNKGLTFSSPGVGNTLHLAAQTFADSTGFELTHVPYKGAAQALNAVMSGEVQAMVIPPTVALPQIKAGKVTVLGFTGTRRWPFLPDVPTIAESVRGFEFDSGWHGLFAPAGTPAPIIERLNAAARRSLAEPKVRDFLVQGGYEPDPQSPADYARYLQGERQRYAAIVKSARIEPE
jgi:tripartite-type tricarboxylate transporter receptor subunit TctC